MLFLGSPTLIFAPPRRRHIGFLGRRRHGVVRADAAPERRKSIQRPSLDVDRGKSLLSFRNRSLLRPLGSRSASFHGSRQKDIELNKIISVTRFIDRVCGETTPDRLEVTTSMLLFKGSDLEFLILKSNLSR